MKNKTNYFKTFVICSNKTYENRTINIMRDCLIMWTRQLANAMDITNKCPIRFTPKEVDGVEWYFVRLTNDQAEKYGFDNEQLSANDQGELNPMLLFDIDAYEYVTPNERRF